MNRKVRKYVCNGKNGDVVQSTDGNLHDMNKLAGTETEFGERESISYTAIGTATVGYNGPGSDKVVSESLE